MKFRFLLIGFLLFSLTSQAQKLDLGIKAGANFSQISDIQDLDNKTGLRAGVFLAVKYQGFAVQPEIIYSEQGGKNNFGEFELNYVNIPIMLKFYIIGDVINLQIGPQFGFVIDNNFPTQAGITQDIKTNDFNFSGAVGIGIDLPIGFRISGRYHRGFTNVFQNMDGKNSMFSVSVGYSFL